MLAGEGAKKFALDNGFEKVNLLTDQSLKDWKKWKKSNGKFQPKANIENHDTIGQLVLDRNGTLAGACTTSGMHLN